jgi:hypothetical protein
MPFRTHPDFTSELKDSSRLWRYVDLPKFMAMIQTGKLNLRNLTALDDAFEGTPTVSDFDFRDWQTPDDAPEHMRMHSIAEGYAQGPDKELGFLRYKARREKAIRRWYAHRKAFFVNCWHRNAHESAAMWEIYSRRNDGVAIVSSTSRMEAALAPSSSEIVGGYIHYGDYSDENFNFGYKDPYAPALHKRHSFASEQEYRLIYRDRNVIHKDAGPAERDLEEVEIAETRENFAVQCDLSALIEKIIISPHARKWFADVVTEAGARYGLSARVYPSDLSAVAMR